VRITVLGACGAWPAAGQACSGFLVEHDGFALLVDAGYATLPRLLGLIPAERLDAVFVSHGHPDHCADLNPLLRARVLSARALSGSPPLPVYALPGALDAVLALEPPGLLEGACALREFTAGDTLAIGPFVAQTSLLPHWVPNAGVRLAADGRVLAYTGDSGPGPEVVALARQADLLLAEATYLDQVPEESRPYMNSAAQAGRQAALAGAGRLALTHLWPGADPEAWLAAAARDYGGTLDVATSGLVIDLG
jgi:ribonuclease BN (tRNA processing enzyme)